MLGSGIEFTCFHCFYMNSTGLPQISLINQFHHFGSGKGCWIVDIFIIGYNES